MHQVRTDSFWIWVRLAWHRGLKQAVNAAAEKLEVAETDDERAGAQRRLEELQRQQADANRNGGSWLH